ncbi:hypothetical protein GZ77_05120 [Endozoicomonas montiporae]|uniref:Uncharacterized protein n=2 Tax=Endozoicomonas montiporae TaxID=1027273 RepID=A0A081NBS1_9GAMM|nr:hypothetical protein [Endozoicomonas montiporae]AMO56197.1 hypothetical protein EZMO1_2078 [Endozoicomonas montiporae CL-33]KEQ15894.1 hypothetical protein GZ77_05120 [Endozoicomonas montiporae]
MNPKSNNQQKGTEKPQWVDQLDRLNENIKVLEEKKARTLESLKKKRNKINRLRNSANKKIISLLGSMIIEAIKKSSIKPSLVSNLIKTHITNKTERNRLRNKEIFKPELYPFLYKNDDNKSDDLESNQTKESQPKDFKPL